MKYSKIYLLIPSSLVPPARSELETGAFFFFFYIVSLKNIYPAAGHRRRRLGRKQNLPGIYSSPLFYVFIFFLVKKFCLKTGVHFPCPPWEVVSIYKYIPKQLGRFLLGTLWVDEGYHRKWYSTCKSYECSLSINCFGFCEFWLIFIKKK